MSQAQTTCDMELDPTQQQEKLKDHMEDIIGSRKHEQLRLYVIIGLLHNTYFISRLKSVS